MIFFWNISLIVRMNENKHMLRNVLHSNFFADVKSMPKKHFEKQWLFDKIIPLTLTSVPSTLALLTR